MRIHDPLNRRQTLATLLALATAGCSGGGGGSSGGGGTVVTPTPTPAPTPTPTPAPSVTAANIKGSAAAKHMRFGSAIAYFAAGVDAGSINNPSYTAMIEHDCTILVPENELKWQYIQPTNSAPNFAAFDAMLTYADSKGLAMRGHNLLWHQRRWMPAWLESYDFGASPATEAARVLTDHIQTICRRYAGRLVSYDVVNEAVDPSTGTLYETALSQAMGGAQATLDLAFRTARAEAPGVQLVYNDYMGWEGGTTHQQGVLNLLQGFKTRGVPVDALGIQSHLGVYSGTSIATLVANQTPAWRTFLDAVVAMGYKILITELDVNDGGLPADIATRDQGVADYVRGYLDLMFSYPQLTDVLCWGICDKYSWLQSFAPRGDGQPLRPCPYDSSFHAKLMQNSINDAFVATTARP